MKFLLFVCGSAAVLIAVAVGCGPQQAYCPDDTTGECNHVDTGTAPPPPDAGGSGDAIIISTD
jgi:hypothetical protein